MSALEAQGRSDTQGRFFPPPVASRPLSSCYSFASLLLASPSLSILPPFRLLPARVRLRLLSTIYLPPAPPSPTCCSSPALPQPPSGPASGPRVLSRGSTCWCSSCHKLSGQCRGACGCFPGGGRAQDQGDSGRLGSVHCWKGIHPGGRQHCCLLGFHP